MEGPREQKRWDEGPTEAVGHLGLWQERAGWRLGSWPSAPGSTRPVPWRMEPESSQASRSSIPATWGKGWVGATSHPHCTSLKDKDLLLWAEMALKQKGACRRRGRRWKSVTRQLLDSPQTNNLQRCSLGATEKVWYTNILILLVWWHGVWL